MIPDTLRIFSLRCLPPLNTNVGLLGETFKYVAPLCGTLGYSAEDAAIAIGLMANSGIKGSQAGTALKTAIANMAAPTDKMAAAMDDLGISLVDSEGNSKDLMSVLLDLRKGFSGLSETEQTAYASMIFGKEAMSGMLAIINSSDKDFDKLTESIYSCDGGSPGYGRYDDRQFARAAYDPEIWG